MGYVVMVFLLGIAIYLWWTGAVRVAEGYTNTRDVEYYVIHRDGHDAQIKNVNQNQQRLTSTPLYLFPAVETTDPAAVDPNLVYVPESFGQAPKDVATYLSHFAVMKKQYDDLRRPMPTHDASRHTVDAMMRVWDVSGLPVLDGSENQITLHPAFAGHTVILQDNANIVSRTDLDTQLQTLIQTLTANQESFDVLFLGSPSNAVPGVLPVAGTKDVYLCTGDTPLSVHAYLVRHQSLPTLYRALVSMDAPLPKKFQNMVALNQIRALIAYPFLVEQRQDLATSV